MQGTYLNYTETDGVGYITCYISDEKTMDEAALNYLLYSNKKIIKYSMGKTDGYMVFYYRPPDEQTLYEYISEKLTKSRTVNIINQLCSFEKRLRENNIDTSYVVWDWNYIYVSRKQEELSFIMVPSSGVSGEKDEFVNLLRFVMSYASYDLSENCTYAAQILTIINSCDYESISRELMRSCDRLSEEIVMRKRKPEAKTINISGYEKFAGEKSLKRGLNSTLEKEKTGTLEDRPPVPCLIRLKTNESIQICKERFLIGKDEEKVDYVIKDNSAVSRIHAIFEKKNGVYYLRDNKSSNKTFVNGISLKEDESILLLSGMIISMANEEFVYKIM